LKSFARDPKEASQTWLLPMASEKAGALRELPIRQTDYFALVDWTGRVIRTDKRGAIPATVKPILQKLGVEKDNWVKNTHYFGNRFGRVLGRIDQIRKLAAKVNQKWLTGVGQARAFYH
jgi:hypothetical protein